MYVIGYLITSSGVEFLPYRQCKTGYSMDTKQTLLWDIRVNEACPPKDTA